MKGAVSDACLRSWFSRVEMIFPSSDRAVEQSAVEVSMNNMRAIISLLFEQQFLEVRENRVGDSLERPVEDRAVSGGFRYYVES